jgi:hypothetical protein
MVLPYADLLALLRAPPLRAVVFFEARLAAPFLAATLRLSFFTAKLTPR